MRFSCFAGEKVFLFGLGGSGLAAAKALIAGGAELTVWDDSAAAVRQAEAEGLTAQDLRAADWRGVKALILAPGVPLTHPKPHWSAALAARAGAEIIGDIELFCREYVLSGSAAPIIAITGTNGKSTTTALTAHLLQAAGRDAQMGGNIGKPVAELAEFSAAGKQVYVLELSSYQIDLSPSLKPAVGIVLNITPDHIDRHGSFANYAAIKERLAAAAGTAIIVCEDEPCRAIYARLKAEGHRVIGISAAEAAALQTDNPALAGRHNALNALCAFAACKAVGAQGFERGLASFRGLPHRLEAVGAAEYKGVKLRFINDSKATNAEAAAPALQSFDNIYWLAGGRAKEGGIDNLLHAETMAHLRGAYFFGEAGAAFAQRFKAAAGHSPYAQAANLAAAFAAALLQAKADIAAGKINRADGAVILLSPACASFDQFKNFEERGAAFRALAQEYCADKF